MIVNFTIDSFVKFKKSMEFLPEEVQTMLNTRCIDDRGVRLAILDTALDIHTKEVNIILEKDEDTWLSELENRGWKQDGRNYEE